MRAVQAFALLLAALPLAGCAGVEEVGSPETNATTPPPPAARFVVDDLAILPASDHGRTLLHEDDDEALVRCVVRQPADAPRESAFVTYQLNGRVIDVQQLTLDPGSERAFVWRVEGLRAMPFVRVEVRAGADVATEDAARHPWPRAGQGALALGPLRARAPYGFLEQDGRLTISIHLDHEGPAPPPAEVRVSLLCGTPSDVLTVAMSARILAPPPSGSSATDVPVRDCSDAPRYGLEFEAVGADGAPLFGRMLFAPRDQTPPREA